MPQLMSGGGQGSMSLRDLLDRLISGAVPPNFDPSTPETAVRTAPGVGQSFDVAQNEGRLAGIANLAKFAQMGRGSVGDPMVTAKQLLSKYRPNLGRGQTGLTIREWMKQQPGRTEAPMFDPDRAELSIPYQHGGAGLEDILQPGAGGFSARSLPSGVTGGSQVIGEVPSVSRESLLHNLYQQLLEANTFGQTHN